MGRLRKSTVNILLVAALVVIFAVSFVVGGTRTDPEERFGGTDGAATAQIEESNPDYQPWFEPFFQPESGEVESGLFALQAALGGVVLGFAFGGLWGRRRSKAAAPDGRPSPDPAA
ncbi:energy-coupling factor ABC transporter substrate-binding protein [Propionicicella superfundia]|uniref:energy-coupling factor ABC transporter substrate-binding protein n=1 Tax=Propionicicella superfundia TaxID=348582 RepID=UPI00041DF7B9|nr:energy-coupling factor ABC transporter substrate-binding protein [Propionicicella superfundia]